MSHSHKRLTRWQKASALVPLALLSGAWTTSLTVTSSASADGTHGKLPDGTSVPSKAIKAPASVSNPGEIAPGVPKGSADEVLAGANASGIPAAALAAYQRAAQVIDKADRSCNIDWTLIAGIGRVESDHGRYGGNTLDSHGVSRPGIYGIPLDGRNGTAKVADTDAGQYDHDPQYDRAVGPMQFIPSTWSVVGVDGDGDGKRNPQDIDDAALATAVYLCSGHEDLSTVPGMRSAVYRYNHSQDYVNLVLAIAQAYADGDYSAVPTSSMGSTTFTPDYGDSVFSMGTNGYHFRKQSSGKGGGARTSGGGGATHSSGGGSTSSSPSVPSGPTTTASDPAAPVTKVVKKAGKTTKDVTKTVTDPVIGLAKATSMCADALHAKYPKASNSQLAGPISTCAGKLKGMTLTQAQNNLAGVVADLKGVICSLPLIC